MGFGCRLLKDEPRIVRSVLMLVFTYIPLPIRFLRDETLDHDGGCGHVISVCAGFLWFETYSFDCRYARGYGPIAEGNFEVELKARRNDELGHLKPHQSNGSALKPLRRTETLLAMRRMNCGSHRADAVGSRNPRTR